jgi:asparagine synthase (glutamine-hydrolysing)
MAHSLESRVPFLDNDLADFAMKLPVKFKLGNLGEVVRIKKVPPQGAVYGNRLLANRWFGTGSV